MRKRIALILAIIVFILSFILNWYSDHLFSTIFIFYFALYVPIIMLFIISFVFAIIDLVKNYKAIIDWIAIAILIFTITIIMFFPFRKVKTNIELTLFERKRLEVIELIKNDKLYTDSLGNVSLPKKYKMLSSDGEAYVYQNDKDTVVSFWVFRGRFSGNVELIYSTGGDELIKKHSFEDDKVRIKKLKENWYYVVTEY